jgi:CHAD domain-containing protein
MIRPYTLAPDDRADASLRKVLGALFNTLQSNVEGVVSDEDIEFLHDLRVANRRTRAALSQVKGVLPSEAVKRFSTEFKWIGTVSGPCRDLDVTLVEIDRYRQDPSCAGERLADLTSFLEAQRKDEHGRVVAALESGRFRELVRGWDDLLQASPAGRADAPLASTRIIDVAGPRVLKAHKRLRKRGAGLSSDSPASLLHKLRIDGKKLRYLLEFFFDLYDPTVVSRFIKQLRRLQNILGDFNDTEVQLALIREFRESQPLDAFDDDTRRLTELIEERQRELRTDFAKRFAAFASEENRKLYKRTFKR